MSDICDIKKLAELFNPKKDNSDSEEDDDFNTINAQPSTSKESCNSGKSSKKPNPYEKLTETKSPLHEYLELNEENEIVFKDDDKNQQGNNWKITPKWDIAYKQQVSAEDVFLQMGLKTPSTSSCEDMIISVHMPEENRHNMDLKVLKDKITLSSPKYFLSLPLPHPVDPQRGNAQWDKDDEKLVVTLRMDRELDCVNF